MWKEDKRAAEAVNEQGEAGGIKKERRKRRRRCERKDEKRETGKKARRGRTEEGMVNEREEARLVVHETS